MRPLRQIKNSISHARVELNPDADQAVLQHLLGELATVTRDALQPRENEALSAADLLTVGCLNAAFRRGGLEAVEQLCDVAAERLGFRPERISVAELINDCYL
ncbi:MAG: hypothetical protein M1376_11030 [Planctomycetes bacterium]|nr:hypothetical protein [Planctomycetota bacterium]